MEVHHHPDLDHKKKKWKEYLLEFLMIFLAVTLGFFAENLREKISEKSRERDYIIGFTNDLQTDIADLKVITAANDLELKGIDTLLSISKLKFTELPVQDSIFFYAIRYTFNLQIFQYTDLTVAQLRNTGGYSLIKTGHIADSIAAYEAKNNNIKEQEKFYIDAHAPAWEIYKQIFDVTLSNSFYHSFIKQKKIPNDINVTITKDAQKINLLYNHYWMLAITLRGYNNMLKGHLEYLSQLINYLKQQ